MKDMSKVRIELNPAGVREFLRSDDMMAVCRDHANDTVASLGDGYEVNTYTGRNRVNAEVAAVSYAAKKDNLENNTILRALR